ncbi:HD domain-containing phosphohydrolase [Pelomicrobium sp. G1]|uniref:HD domain-containing phosphohydrolase n=1 Tax=unclassified Pelomicrobium TaxID=2815318 RepID=UPI003F76D40C
MHALSTKDLLARLEELNAVGSALSKEKDLSSLLEAILKAAKRITHAEAGTLYLMEGGERLRFELVHNDALGIAMGGTSGVPIPFYPVRLYDDAGRPNNSMVVAFAALRGETVNIPDAYAAEGFDFSGTRNFDAKTGYRSKSFLAVPMKNHEKETIGVLQLINAKDRLTGEIVPFSDADRRLAESLASQAAIALTNRQLIGQLERLFESFIGLINAAIDEKSPYTAGHCQRVPVLTMMFADAVCAVAAGPFKDFTMTDADRYELKIAGLLHDCGKVTTPVHIVDKATKLQTIFDRIHLIDTRFEVLKRDAEIAMLRQLMALDTASCNLLPSLEREGSSARAGPRPGASPRPIPSALTPVPSLRGERSLPVSFSSSLLTHQGDRNPAQSASSHLSSPLGGASPSSSSSPQRGEENGPVPLSLWEKVSGEDSPGTVGCASAHRSGGNSDEPVRFASLNTPDRKAGYASAPRPGISSLWLENAPRAERRAAIERECRERLAQIEADRDFLRKCNLGVEAMRPEDQVRVRQIASRYTWTDATGKEVPFLTDDEVENLTIKKGTLTAKEREIINHHIVVTLRMLESLPWPAHLKNVPEYAGGHHERVDGKGYPRGLTKDRMSVQARMMAIADIFEALTAADRPYKRGKTLSEALSILGQFALNGHIDPDLFQVFVREKVYLRYAKQFLEPEQIDEVDEAQIPGYDPRAFEPSDRK